MSVRQFVEVAFFWNDKPIGSSIISPQMIELGAVVVVKVPHPSPNETLVKNAFRARSPDGRAFTIDIVRVKPDTNPSDAEPSATISGYLRKLPS